MSTPFVRPADTLSSTQWSGAGRIGASPSSATETAAETASSPLGFILFIVLTGVLFIRPAEIIPTLEAVPIYEIVILCCLVVSFPAVLEQLRPKVLASRPVNVCVLGLLPAVLMSHLWHLQFGFAWESGVIFAKILVYYLLFVSLVTTLSRLRCFLFWLVVFVSVLTVVALLQFHGIIDLPTLQEIEERMGETATGEAAILVRLCSTGIFHDPNDLSLILVAGMAACLYWMGERGLGPARLLWLVPLGTFGYALTLTHSRGGFMALLAATLVLFEARFGWRKAIPLALVVVPLLLQLFGGRQTEVDLSNPEGSAQARIQLWVAALEALKRAPLFGIGMDQFFEEAGHVVHNSYMQAFTELGLFGGTLFAGVFFLSLWGLRRVGVVPQPALNPAVHRLRPYLLAMVVGYAVGMFSLSRGYTVPTYVVPALVVSYLGLPAVCQRGPLPAFGPRLVALLGAVSIVTLLVIYLFVRIYAQ
jgi:O-antigen ligase